MSEYITRTIDIPAENLRKDDVILKALDSNDRLRRGRVVQAQAGRIWLKVTVSFDPEPGKPAKIITFTMNPADQVLVSRTELSPEAKDAFIAGFFLENAARRYQQAQTRCAQARARLIQLVARKEEDRLSGEYITTAACELHVAEELLRTWEQVILPLMEKGGLDVRPAWQDAVRRIVERIGWSLNHSTSELTNALRNEVARELVKMTDVYFIH